MMCNDGVGLSLHVCAKLGCGRKHEFVQYEGESLFDPGSGMGLEVDVGSDHWEYDVSNAS